MKLISASPRQNVAIKLLILIYLRRHRHRQRDLCHRDGSRPTCCLKDDCLCY